MSGYNFFGGGRGRRQIENPVPARETARPMPSDSDSGKWVTASEPPRAEELSNNRRKEANCRLVVTFPRQNNCEECSPQKSVTNEVQTGADF